jgi:DNA-binding transcriptional ArsR family regulator
MTSFANLFKALGDQNRVMILDLLRERDMTPSELLTRMSISQPTLSHHLDVLKRAELVEAVREGQFIRYSLNMSVFQMIVQFGKKMTSRRTAP